jgi:glycosyltransferase involved in cell wall biosynthesis
VDDNDMAYRWNRAGIVHHDFSSEIGVKFYRRKSGSFKRLFDEIGVWPAGYGSVYEKRLVKLWQDYPEQGNQWNHFGEYPLKVSCVMLGWNEYPMFTRAIKALHDDLKDIPHEIIFVNNGSTDETTWWLDTYALRQHHGDITIDAKTGAIIKRGKDNEATWTGNVIRVDLPENAGAGHGYNEGFKRARGEYIFYLSGDILPVIGSVSALAEYLDKTSDTDYVGVNAWTSQADTEIVEFHGYDCEPRQGLGNYAFCYAMMRRKVIDAGVRMAEDGPFAGPGCGYEDAEFADQMYAKGFKAWIFNHPTYHHYRRDFKRSGLVLNEEQAEMEKQAKLRERRRWLCTRWPEQRYDIVHHGNQPPTRHIRKAGIVWKAVPGQPGPGGHFMAAMQDICQVQQFEPNAITPGLDSYFFVDNGDYDHFDCPQYAHPSAFWAIDMIPPQQGWRPSLDGYVRRARTFDRVFAAQPGAVEHFEQNGIKAEWLPLAVNPDYFKPWSEEVIFDWIALWHNCGDRIAYADAAGRAFPRGFVGWKDGLEYSRWFCKARCALNLSRSNEITLRVFEVMASGVPLVTDRARGLDLLFEEEKHYRGFSSIEEMLDQITWVKTHTNEAARMAKRARTLVLSKHTYYHRVLQVYGGE